MCVKAPAKVIEGLLNTRYQLASARNHSTDNIAMSIQVLCGAVYHEIVAPTHRLEQGRGQQGAINHAIQRMFTSKRYQSVVISNLQQRIRGRLGPHELGVRPDEARELLRVGTGVEEIVRDAVALQIMRDEAIRSS